jgi:predicted Zn-dependent protease
MRHPLLPAALLALVVACATAPSGRRQLLLVADEQLEPAAVASFEQIRARYPELRDPERQALLGCVVEGLTRALPPSWQGLRWQIAILDAPEINAFALPGGRIGVYRGLLERFPDPDRLAAVLGHEIAHVVFRHGAERVSQQFAAATALELGAIARDGGREERSRELFALLGLGAQVGVLLPFSRLHEQEADRYGQELMSRAGFDPRAAASVWRELENAQRGPRPPAWLSTHPAPGERAAELSARAEALLPLYEEAISAGRRPACAPRR